MLIMFCILSFIPRSFAFSLSDPYTKFSKLNLPLGVKADSVSLDPLNQGPLAAISDGRILKYNGTNFVDFAYLSPNRSKQLCDGAQDIGLGMICGRPLGFTFDPETGNLYVVGAYGGFYRVGPQGGQATLLATSAYGVPFNFLNGCDFDKIRRVVYFTDTSLVYNYTDAILGNPLPPGDSSGRLLEYSTITGLVRVLVNGIPRPSGPAVSADSSFIVYGSYSTQQIYKYYLIGPKSGTTDVLIPNLLGSPAKTKRAAEFGYFWVAVNQVVQTQPTPVFQPYGYKFSSNGNVIVIKNFTLEYGNGRVNVVQEYFNLLEGGTLYVGSRSANYVGKYTKC